MSVATAMEPQLRETPFLLAADIFQAAVEAGLFPGDERIYLRDGLIYENTSRTKTHCALGAHFFASLVRRLPPGYSVFPVGHFKVDEFNTRLPEIAIARGDDPRAFLATDGFPQARDLVLVVEVVATSIAEELGSNLEHYARAALPTYWVADFPGLRILAHSRPRVLDGKALYEQVEEIGPDGTLPLMIDDREVARFAYEDLMP
jgi:Putative restriction endonuclease